MTIFYGMFQKFLDDDKFTEPSLHLTKNILKTDHLTTKIAKFVIIGDMISMNRRKKNRPGIVIPLL